MKSLIIKIPDELHKQLKIYCAEKGITVKELITKLIEGLVKEER